MINTDKLLEYCSPSAEISVTKRFSPCPICNRGKNAFVVTRTTEGYVMFCHRCHASRFVPSGGKVYVPPKSEVNRRIKNILVQEVKDKRQEYVYLPRDASSEIPIVPMAWLKQYRITDAEIEAYKFCWSDTYRRLILPVYKDGNLIYWQGRYFGDNPAESKYLNMRSSKEDIMFITDGGDNDNATILVIVEDIISAVAIQRTGCRALALLGSNLPDYVVTYLVQQASLDEHLQVKVWLDRDKRSASVEYSQRLNTFDVNSTWVSTPLDPKEYSPEEILVHLNI